LLCSNKIRAHTLGDKNGFFIAIYNAPFGFCSAAVSNQFYKWHIYLSLFNEICKITGIKLKGNLWKIP
jgi:hypothetical protein